MDKYNDYYERELFGIRRVIERFKHRRRFSDNQYFWFFRYRSIAGG